MGGMDERDRPPMPARQSQVDLMRRLDDFSLRENAAHGQRSALGGRDGMSEGGRRLHSTTKIACCFQGMLLGSRNN